MTIETCPRTSTCSPPSRSPRATRTRSATRSPTACSTRCWPTTPTAASPARCLVNTGLVVVAGEISTETYVDIPTIARDTLHRIGYDRAKYGFDADTCAVITAIDEQSPDIAQGVDDAPMRLAPSPTTGTSSIGRGRRPGNDVRLRDPRDRGADADADPDRAHARPPAGRGPQGRGRPLPAARRQDPGDGSLRERPPGGDREAPDLDPARPDSTARR